MIGVSHWERFFYNQHKPSKNRFMASLGSTFIFIFCSTIFGGISSPRSHPTNTQPCARLPAKSTLVPGLSCVCTSLWCLQLQLHFHCPPCQQSLVLFMVRSQQQASLGHHSLQIPLYFLLCKSVGPCTGQDRYLLKKLGGCCYKCERKVKNGCLRKPNGTIVPLPWHTLVLVGLVWRGMVGRLVIYELVTRLLGNGIVDDDRSLCVVVDKQKDHDRSHKVSEGDTIPVHSALSKGASIQLNSTEEVTLSRTVELIWSAVIYRTWFL
jgi:hypothetical protein